MGSGSGLREEDLNRIHRALQAAGEALGPFLAGPVAFRQKPGQEGPVTEADLAVDRVLRVLLPQDGEGWLSEESQDDPARLDCRRVWVADPLDGTKEFVQGIPEWCISVGLLEDGIPVAGGIYAPSKDLLILGSRETGVFCNGARVGLTERKALAGATVLASRSEWQRGEWEAFVGGPFRLVPCGSVALKLALVAAGLADATWTLVPKCEWDVAGGAALVLAGGGSVLHADGTLPRWNQPSPCLPNLLAGREELLREVRQMWLGSK